ncbi:MAG: type II secretion system F family protein [Candidatus Omnitrophica bacterium]|nr:type II secretion system F family protein [Candidatus Omnitrophota bacterium]
MPIYNYKAKTSPNTFRNGTIEAESEKAAVNKLRLLNYYPISIELKTEECSKYFQFKRKISNKDIYIFLRQLANLNLAGLSLVKSLKNIGDQSSHKALQAVIVAMRENIQKGNSFSQALEMNNKVFSALEVNMVKSAESTGTLAQVLSEIADLKEKDMEFSTRIRSAMAYPILLVSVGILTLFLLTTFVLPKFITLFQELGESLPLLTQLLILLSTFLSHYWIGVVLGCAIFAGFSLKYFKTESGRLWFDQFKLKIPGLRNIIIKIQTERFARTLASLIKNGVPIINSLKIVSEVATNKVFSQEISQIHALVSKGQNISQAIKSSLVFDRNVVDLISAGEESGMLEDMLLRIAQMNENESKQLIESFLFMLEPILILSLGAIIGIIVLAILLPVFEMNFLIQ